MTRRSPDPIYHPGPTPWTFLVDVTTVSLMGTIAYIGLTATTPGWMILGACFMFFTVFQLIDLFGQFF